MTLGTFKTDMYDILMILKNRFKFENLMFDKFSITSIPRTSPQMYGYLPTYGKSENENI